MLQYRGMQLVGKAPDAFGNLRHVLLDSFALLARPGLFGGNLLPQITHADTEGRDLLADIVVQLAREAAALLLLRVEQARAQGFDLLLGAIALADVADD